MITEYVFKSGKRAHNIPLFTLLEYYTPKTIIFQAVLDNIAFFVNSAEFYVNSVMSTIASMFVFRFINFDYLSISRLWQWPHSTKYSFCKISVIVFFSYALLPVFYQFVQLNEGGIF